MDKEDVAEVAVDALGDVVFVEVAKVAPSVTVTGFTFFGHPLSEWAQLLAIIYSSLMIFFLLRDRAWPTMKQKFKDLFM